MVPAETEAPAPSPAVADASQMTTVEEVVEEGMTPVGPENLLDGEYPVQVNCSSSMFRIESAVLRVSDGAMEAELTMGGKSYLYVYPGTALEAATSEENAYIPFVENAEGAHTFTIPVSALDAPVPCAAFSKNKELWYDRTLLFRVDSLPMEAFREGFFTTAGRLGLADGNYSVAVSLAGGSGKASVESPAALTVKYGGTASARRGSSFPAKTTIMCASAIWSFCPSIPKATLPLTSRLPSSTGRCPSWPIPLP